MALIKGGLLFVAPIGVGMTRAQASGAGFQVAKAPHWSKKPVVFRNAPYTNVSPTKGQMETRVAFADIASAHKGEKGFKDGLPIIAYYIKENMKKYSAPNRMAPEDYPSKHRRTFHTANELKRILEEGKR